MKKKLPKIGTIVVGQDYDGIVGLYRFCGWGWQYQFTSSTWEEIEAPFKWSYISWNETNG